MAGHRRGDLGRGGTERAVARAVGDGLRGGICLSYIGTAGSVARTFCTTRFIPYKSPEHSVQLASGGEAICPRGSVQELGSRAETSGRTILWAQPSSPDAGTLRPKGARACVVPRLELYNSRPVRYNSLRPFCTTRFETGRRYVQVAYGSPRAVFA